MISPYHPIRCNCGFLTCEFHHPPTERQWYPSGCSRLSLSIHFILLPSNRSPSLITLPPPAMTSSSTSRSPSASPDRIGPFHIGREIGKGSFAVVHKGLQVQQDDSGKAATDGNGSKEVAIKIVTRRKLSQKLLDNLQGEIAILKAVSHPNIIELIDCLKTETHIYLIMDYSSGGDLSQYIRRKGALAADCVQPKSFVTASKEYPHPTDGGLHAQVIRSFLAQLASAMEFMRVRNIVHRDIKPQVSRCV